MSVSRVQAEDSDNIVDIIWYGGRPHMITIIVMKETIYDRN